MLISESSINASSVSSVYSSDVGLYIKNISKNGLARFSNIPEGVIIVIFYPNTTKTLQLHYKLMTSLCSNEILHIIAYSDRTVKSK